MSKRGRLARKGGRGLRANADARLHLGAALGHPRGDEKHSQQFVRRFAPPFIREVLAAFRPWELTATVAAAELGLGRSRF